MRGTEQMTPFILGYADSTDGNASYRSCVGRRAHASKL